MNAKLRLASQAWVFGVLFFLQDYTSLLASSGERRMISPVPLTPLVMAHLAQILLVALVYFGIVTLLRRFTPWNITQWVVAVLTFFFLVIRLRPYLTLIPKGGHYTRYLVLTLFALGAFFAVKKFPRALLQVKTVAGTLMAGFVFFAILISGELLRLVFWHPAPQGFTHAVTAPEDPNRPRLVWVVFDELDYNQTFGHRAPSLQLPNFDRLRGQSILYSNVPPIMRRTFEAVPSFLTGSVVSKLQYTWDNRIQVKGPSDRSWRALPVEDTAFAAAHRAGLRSAIVGWAIPYCHAFEQVVDQCYWTNHDASWDGPQVAPQDGFLHDFLEPLGFLAEDTFANHDAQVAYEQTMAFNHNLTVDDLTAHAVDTLENSHADVIYVHLPVPHPPSARDRRTHQFAAGGSYLDGLSHADDILGQLLDILQGQPRWQHTTLIVQGDHGWRDWASTRVWTPEDRAIWLASPRDVHPVVLVHQAGQTGPETVSAEISLLGVHDTALAVVRQMKP